MRANDVLIQLEHLVQKHFEGEDTSIISSLFSYSRKKSQEIPNSIIGKEALQKISKVRLSHYPQIEGEALDHRLSKVKSWKQQNPNLNGLVFLWHDLLWDLITFESKKRCTACNRQNFQVLYDGASKNTLVYSCPRCEFKADLEGNSWKDNGKLWLPSKRMLHHGKFLKFGLLSFLSGFLFST